MAFPYKFGSPTPVIITDQSGSTGTSANIPVVDAATGAVNSTAPLFAEQIGWLDGSGNLQAVSAANPLPVTSSGGGSGNVTIVGPLGQSLAAASVPVVLTAAQITTLTPPAAITNFANETGGNLAAIKAKTDNIPAQGQALAAASLPVVLTAAQIVTLTPPGAITNYALETGGNLAIVAGAVSSNVVQSNTKQVNGVTTLAGAGAVGTGSQRVAIGQDTTTIAGSAPGTAGSASTNVITVQGVTSMTKLLVTPDSVALPSNQSVNVSQINGVTPLMGTGNTGTGSLRVTIATDQAQLTNKLLVTPDANSAVNISQINGVTVTMGNGASGTGVQRVTLASDSTGQVALAAGTALVGKISGSDETSTIYSGTTALTPGMATISVSATGTLVALVSSKQIRVLALSLMSNGTVNVKFQSHASPTDITGLYYLIANTGFVLPYNPLGWFQTIAGEALDINLSASIAVGGCLTYVAV